MKMDEKLKIIKRNKFIEFLMHNYMYERFINTCIQHKANKSTLEFTLLKSSYPGYLFDHLLNWWAQAEGWNYWANVSYQWKLFCIKNKLQDAQTINMFETHNEMWKEINLIAYNKSHKN